MNENIRKLLESKDAIQRKFEAYADAMKMVNYQAAAEQLMTESRTQEEAMRRLHQSKGEEMMFMQPSSAAQIAREWGSHDEALRRQFQPIADTLKFAQGSSAAHFAREIASHEKAFRAAFGPVDELRRSGIWDAKLKLDSEYARIADRVTEIQERFQLPALSETRRLIEQMNGSRLVAERLSSHEHQTSIKRAMDAMRAPWLDMQDKFRSMTAFTELQGIGLTLRSLPAFNINVTQALRIELGDWRKEITWPSEIFTDAVARSAFYEAQGLNPNLTAFPADAFHQSIEIAGLKSVSPAPAQEYSVEAEGIDEEEKGFERTNAAHDRLLRFESCLRQFIAHKMAEMFGENWIKHQVPDTIRKNWIKKHQKARDSGEREAPLIAYADFTDYVPLIIGNDNWEKAFKPIFRRKSSVEESFQRLYPIRICTMHARIITQDDELFLYVETKRLLAAIGVKT
jgi:Swt1-like HEPN